MKEMLVERASLRKMMRYSAGGADKMSNDYYRGYAAGRNSMQPEWNSADITPPRDGHYYTVKEALRGFPGHTMGSVVVDTTEYWRKGKWNQNDKFWKVLYWAVPPVLELPEGLEKRHRINAA